MVTFVFGLNIQVTVLDMWDTGSTPRNLYEIVLMILYLFGVTTDHSDIFYVTMIIPRINLHLSFLLLAIDRVIGVAFPYRHRKIMTTRVVYTLITVAWLIAAVLAFIAKMSSTMLFVPPLGNFQPSFNPAGSTIILMSMLMSVVLIAVSNAYLFYVTTQSNKRLLKNRNLSDREGNEINKTQRLLKALQMQANTTASALILGGIDCAMIVLMFILFAVVDSPSFSSITSVYIFQMIYPIEWCQMLSHFFIYGIYMKEIRRCIQKYKFYQRLHRMLHLYPNQVAPQ